MGLPSRPRQLSVPPGSVNECNYMDYGGGQSRAVYDCRPKSVGLGLGLQPRLYACSICETAPLQWQYVICGDMPLALAH